MKKRRKQYSAGAIIWIIFKYVSLVFFSFVAVIPIISCVITAFKTEEEYKTTIRSLTYTLIQYIVEAVA